ncbi:MAG: putative glycoside hydrolase [bacterium]|nr:putative glycoside hydrolase [bacterium]
MPKRLDIEKPALSEKSHPERAGKKIGFNRPRKIVYGLILVLALFNAIFYFFGGHTVLDSPADLNNFSQSALQPTPVPKKLQPRPEVIKGIYVTAHTFRLSRFKDLVALVKRTELNAMIIDVKDSWNIHFDDYLRNKITELHKENIYLIARIVVFQDHQFAKSNPDVALKLKDGSLWSDNKKTYWTDPASRKVWDYNIEIAKKAIDYGFDELNFDYIRFPSEKITSIIYPVYNGATPKHEIIKSFWQYLYRKLKEYDPEIVLSADLFAFNMISEGDLGIGQRFRDSFDVFDVAAPMIYPSHYSPGNFGFKNPAEHPYEVVYQSLVKGREQIERYASTTSTVIRPWLQDFKMGADYNAAMIRQEIKAVYDAGFDKGWMLWNANNVYTEGALLRE